MSIRDWLLAQESRIAQRWFLELKAGAGGAGEDGLHLLETLVENLVSLLPACFGEQREVATQVWQQAAHLYGSVAVRRGLAAGEVVDELQLLRNVILRLLLVETSTGLSDGRQDGVIPPLELLTLNRLLDMGVSRASIAYVDDLFFAHLQGSGVSEGVTPELVEETRCQLAGLWTELKN